MFGDIVESSVVSYNVPRIVRFGLMLREVAHGLEEGLQMLCCMKSLNLAFAHSSWTGDRC